MRNRIYRERRFGANRPYMRRRLMQERVVPRRKIVAWLEKEISRELGRGGDFGSMDQRDLGRVIRGIWDSYHREFNYKDYADDLDDYYGSEFELRVENVLARVWDEVLLGQYNLSGFYGYERTLDRFL